ATLSAARLKAYILRLKFCRGSSVRGGDTVAQPASSSAATMGRTRLDRMALKGRMGWIGWPRGKGAILHGGLQSETQARGRCSPARSRAGRLCRFANPRDKTWHALPWKTA